MLSFCLCWRQWRRKMRLRLTRVLDAISRGQICKDGEGRVATQKSWDKIVPGRSCSDDHCSSSFLLPSGQVSGSCFLDPRWGVGNHYASMMGLSLVSPIAPRLSISDSMMHSLGMGRSWTPLQGPVYLSLWSWKKKAGQAAGAPGASFLSFSSFSQNILSWMKQCDFILIFPLTCETGFYTTAIKKHP